jgi:DUF4097 and DUF4098 domain-containing protein YvlB
VKERARRVDCVRTIDGVTDLPFAVPLDGHSRIRVNGTRSGKVYVTAEPRSDLLVEAGVRHEGHVKQEGRAQLTVGASNGSGELRLRVPEGTDLVLGTLSGAVRVSGRAGATVVSTASGDISVEQALTADLRSISGKIDVGICAGRCRLASASGKLQASRTGQAEVSTVSGNVDLKMADGEVKVRTTSGKVDVCSAGAHDVLVHTISGSVKVRVPEDVRPEARIRSFSGKPRIDVEQGSDCSVAVSTFSGKVEVVPG